MSAKHRTVRRQLFPEKLWDLVNKPSSGIQWSPDGKRIQVERTQLEKFIGTKFRSHNFDSFIRQLHFYGFRKCGNSYHHDKFQRGQPEALLTMKRKYSNLTMGSLCRVNPHSPCYTSNMSNASSNDSSSAADSFLGSNSSNNNNHCHHNNNNLTNDQDGNNNHGIVSNESPRSENLDMMVNEIIDLSGAAGNINNYSVAQTSVCHGQDNDCAIDYSRKTKHNSQLQSPIKQSPTKCTSGKKRPVIKNDHHQEITMYAIKPTKTIQTSASSSFTASLIPRTSDKTDLANQHSIRITMPEILKEADEIAWPKSLVLENYWIGDQSILSAYFIYKTNE